MDIFIHNKRTMVRAHISRPRSHDCRGRIVKTLRLLRRVAKSSNAVLRAIASCERTVYVWFVCVFSAIEVLL